MVCGVRLSESSSLTRPASRKASGENLSLQPHHDLFPSKRQQTTTYMSLIATMNCRNQIGNFITECVCIGWQSKNLSHTASRFSRCCKVEASATGIPIWFVHLIYLSIHCGCVRFILASRSAKSTTAPTFCLGERTTWLCTACCQAGHSGLLPLKWRLVRRLFTITHSSPLHTSPLYKNKHQNQINAQDLIISV